MYWYYFISSFILNVSNAIKSSDIIDAVTIDHVEKSKFLSNVRIGEYEYCIYIYDPDLQMTNKDELTVLNKFYIMTNCKFAEWTQYELFSFVERFPKSQEELLQNYKAYTKDYNALLNDIEKYLIRFENVLFELLKITAAYADTSLLKTLIVLRYKIHFITSLLKMFIPETFESDNDVKYIFLETINSIQNFMNLNCAVPIVTVEEHTSELKKYFGYGMTKSETNIDSIDGFLDYITKRIHLEPLTQCEVEQMLLKTIVTDTSQESNFLNLSSTEIKIKNKKVSILNYFKKVTQQYDLELILTYQDFLFNIMVKIICRETLKILNNTDITLSDDLKRIFLEVDGLILLKTNQHLLIDLTDCFRDIGEYRNHDAHEIKKTIKIIQKYSNSLNNVILPEDKFPTVSKLEEFVKEVKKHNVEYECFKKSYQFLFTEFTKFYNPFLHRPLNIQKFVNHKKTSENDQDQDIKRNEVKSFVYECNYVNILFKVLFQVNVYLNDTFIKKANQKLIIEILRIILNSSIVLVERLKAHVNDDDILSIAYDMYVVINTSYDKHFNKENVRRVVFTLITHLNHYALKRCNPLCKKFMVLDQPKTSIIDLTVNTRNQLKIIVEIFSKKLEKNKEVDFLNIPFFYSGHVQITNVFAEYQNVFKFHWKGEKKSIINIFESIKSAVLSTSHVLAFYEVYFKFMIGATYYEIKLIFDYLKLKSEGGFPKKFKPQKYQLFHNMINIDFIERRFPKCFSYLITEIRRFSNYVLDTFLNKLISYGNKTCNNESHIEANITDIRSKATVMQYNIENIMNYRFRIFVDNIVVSQHILKNIANKIINNGVKINFTSDLFKFIGTMNEMVTISLTNV